MCKLDIKLGEEALAIALRKAWACSLLCRLPAQGLPKGCHRGCHRAAQARVLPLRRCRSLPLRRCLGLQLLQEANLLQVLFRPLVVLGGVGALWPLY